MQAVGAVIVQKKLIVSRQPIFTNLKSNTMKNDAKVQRLAVPRNYLQEKSFECVTF